MSDEASEAARDLVTHRWANATVEDRRKVGQTLAEGRRKAAKARSKRKKKKPAK